MKQFEYKRVSTVPEAVSVAGKTSNTAFLAGGTNLVDLMKRGVSAPEKIVDINDLPLQNIEQTATGIRLGALARNSDTAGHPLVQKYFPLLPQALNAGASPQLRNMASTGGNMMQRTRCPYFYDIVMPCNKRSPGSGCSAIGGYNRMHAIFGSSEQCIAVHPSDMCVALAALDASVFLSNGKAERKIKFVDFHRLPGETPALDNNLKKGELITGVEIPFNEFSPSSHYLKVRDRASYAFALVSVAVGLNIKDNIIQEARIAMGGVAHKPWRLFEAEQALKGQPATEAIFSKASAIAMKGAKAYGRNDFKLKLAPASIETALQMAAAKNM